MLLPLSEVDELAPRLRALEKEEPVLCAWRYHDEVAAAECRTRGEFREALSRRFSLPPPGDREQENLLKALHALYFETCIPMPIPVKVGYLRPLTGWHIAKMGGTAALAPGRHRGLDVVCNGILNGSPFVFDPDRSADA